MKGYLLRLSYDGKSFHGWQRQPGGNTIEQALSEALETLGIKAYIRSSGRTDSGVSAKFQAVSLETDSEIIEYKLQNSLNALLPPEIKVLELVESNISPRADSKTKCYSYKLSLTDCKLPLVTALPVGTNFNIAAVLELQKSVEGTHDFSAYRASDCGAEHAVRTVLFSEFTRVDENLLEYRIHGKGFLKQMVRILVGTFIEIGRGQRNCRNLLEYKARSEAGFTAPPEPLSLEWISFSDS